MVIKTELCAFSEWKIYPGRGIRYVARDGRPFLFLSKRTRDFGVRYALHYQENSKLRDLDGLLPGEDSTKNLNFLMLAKNKKRESSNKKEPSKVSLLKISKSSRLLDLKIKKHLPKKLLEKLSNARKPKLPRRPAPKNLKERIKTPNKKPKTRLPKRTKRRLPQSLERNDESLFKICPSHNQSHSILI